MTDSRQKQWIRQIISRWFKFSLRIFGRSVPVISIIVTVISYIYIVLIAITVYNLSQMAGSSSEKTLIMTTNKSFELMFGIVFGTFAGIFSYLFIPGFISFILAFPCSILWRSPVQILLLRKFHKNDASRSLKKAVRKYIAPIGHTYSLADENIKIPWYIKLPVVFTQLAFLHFRQRKIKTKRQINRLLAGAEVKFARNINWMVSWNKIFPIHCSENSWKSCVIKMMWRFDAILVDVSELSENIIWEIKYAKDEGLLEKNLFLTTVEKKRESIEKLQEIGLGHLIEDRLFIYDSDDCKRVMQRLENMKTMKVASQFPQKEQVSLSKFLRFSVRLSNIAQIIGPFIGMLLLAWLFVN